MRKLTKGLFAGAILALGVSAASAATYHRGSDGDPETLDQHKTSTVNEANLLRDLYEGLVIYDAKAKVIPGVATEWSISDDGTTYTFNLRDDAKWSNGDPVVAEDFVFSLRRIMNPETGAKYANILYPIKNAEAINKGEKDVSELGVKAVDDHTLEITLESPTPYFLELLTHQTGLPVNPKAVKEYGSDFVQPENMVTNGAYTLKSFTPNDKIVMEKSDTFHDADSVKIDTIEFIPFEDRAACVRRFEAGEIDSCSDLPGEQIPDLKKRLGDKVHVAPYLGVYYYSVNTTREPFGDAKVRQAMSMVIDRQFLAEEIWGGTMVPAFSWVPPGIGNYLDDAPRFEYADMSLLDREDKAIELMKEAGYGPDKPLTVEIAYNASENHKNTATAIADMWKPLGINVEYNVRDASAHYAMLRDDKDFDVARAGWIGDYSDPQNFLFLNESDNTGFNYPQWENADYDKLMQEAETQTDLDQRAQTLAKAEKLLLDQTPQIPLLFYSSLSLVSDRLNGWEDNIQNVHATRFLSLAD